MMRVLVTGARGQLGQELVRELGRGRYMLEATDVDELDISDLGAVRRAVRGFQALINCAAYNDVDRAESEEHRAISINALGPRNLAIACEEKGAALMHFSTDFVFDGAKTAPYTIADEPRPLSAYARSKLRGEREVAAHCRRFYVVRLSWLFGQSGQANFPRKVLAWAKGKEVLKVVDDQVSRPTYTADVAPVLIKLLESGAYGLYHLANRGLCSRFEWASHIVNAAGLPVKVLPAKTGEFQEAARRPAYSALDLHPLDQMFGPLPHWQDATDRFLAGIGVRR